MLGPYTFSIGNLSSYQPYIGGGLFSQAKMPQTLSFVSG